MQPAPRNSYRDGHHDITLRQYRIGHQAITLSLPSQSLRPPPLVSPKTRSAQLAITLRLPSPSRPVVSKYVEEGNSLALAPSAVAFRLLRARLAAVATAQQIELEAALELPLVVNQASLERVVFPLLAS